MVFVCCEHFGTSRVFIHAVLGLCAPNKALPDREVLQQFGQHVLHSFAASLLLLTRGAKHAAHHALVLSAVMAVELKQRNGV